MTIVAVEQLFEAVSVRAQWKRGNPNGLIADESGHSAERYGSIPSGERGLHPVDGRLRAARVATARHHRAGEISEGFEKRGLLRRCRRRQE